MTDSNEVISGTGDSIEDRKSFVSKIDVKAEAAVNGHFDHPINGDLGNGEAEQLNCEKVNGDAEVGNGDINHVNGDGTSQNEPVGNQDSSQNQEKIFENKTGQSEIVNGNGILKTPDMNCEVREEIDANVNNSEQTGDSSENAQNGGQEVGGGDNETILNGNAETQKAVAVEDIVISAVDSTENVGKEVAEVVVKDKVNDVSDTEITGSEKTVIEKKKSRTGLDEISVRGIDEVIPADNLYTHERNGAVKIRMGKKGNQADKPLTIITEFKKTAERAPNHLALAVKRDGDWKKWTYREYFSDVVTAAKAFIKLGLEPKHGVGILGFNSPEWLISDLGCIFAGGLATGIYATNTPEAVEFVTKHSEANVLVVENNQQLQKGLKIWPNLPHLKAIVQYTGEVAEKRENVYSWKEFMSLAEDVPTEMLQERINNQRPNTCCTLIYTSGTTGDPKGVMLSHDNMVWTAHGFAKAFTLQFEYEVLVSYLPLSHVAAQMIDITFPVAYGASVYFARPDALKLTWTTNAVIKTMEMNFGSEITVSYLPLSHIAAQLLDILIPVQCAAAVYFADADALKGSLLGTLKEVRPTGFFGVPRVWEKFYEGIKANSKNAGAIRRKIAMWAKGVGLKGSYAKMNGQSLPFGHGLANALVFKKARLALGLDRCRFFMSGAAPIMKETLEFFYSINMVLHEVYGMSESTGPHCIGTDDNFTICSVGKEFPGAETKLSSPDEDGNGEICMSGRHVFMGYLNALDKNVEIFDSDGWLKSGDIGKHDNKDFLYITGRLKELIITAGGENIAPVPIESNVKESLPCISNCMLIGDKRKFLSMILCLKVDINPDTGAPTDQLTQDTIQWCKSLGSNATTVADVIDKKDAVVLKAIQDGIDKANEKSVSRASKVQKWSIIPNDFSIAGGELGPTLKLRRPVVSKMYKKTIDAFYTEAE